MMLRFILLLIMTVVLALLGYWLYVNPGFVLLNWLGYEFRIPIFILVITLALLLLICTIIFKFLTWLLRLPVRLSRRLTSKRKLRGERELVFLASAVAAENAPEALKHLKRAKLAQEEEPLYWWYAAQAQGLAERHLEESKAYGTLMNQAPFLSLKGQTLAALRRDDRQSALEYLEKARDIDPHSPWVLRNLLTLYRGFKRYEEAEQVINELEDLRYLNEQQAKKQLVSIYELMSQDTQYSEQAREEALRKAHFLDPSLAHLTETYARLMFGQGHETNALKALEATWEAYPTQAIGDTYIELQAPESPMAAYELAKKLVKGTTHTENQILLARYALKAKLWGETRKMLEKLEKSTPSPAIYKLLADLELQEHNNIKAAHTWAMKGYET